MAEPISVTAYARLRGVSHTAVQQRIKAGSLPTSARQIKGRWMIIDVDLANREWNSHTRPWVGTRGGPVARPAPPPSALADATLRERKARAWAIELDIARRTRDLVSARDVERIWASEIVEARTALLGVPSRAKHLIPELTPGAQAILDSLIREALEGLANRSWRDSDAPVMAGG